jgi:hypothetical protein
MALQNYLFTSESVTEGHPDKLCDNVSDAILDAHLAGDPNARVACETAVKTGFVLIAGEITAALDWLAARETARTCVLSGWSAGGHLTALAMAHPFVAAGLSISGVFDLEPIRHSYINEKLGLDAAEARDLSPAKVPPVAKPMAVAYGDTELPELQRQSIDYGAYRALAVAQTIVLPLPGHDHFSILEELSRPDGRLCAQALALASPTRQQDGQSLDRAR